MNITFYGHACMLVEHQDKKVIIDPFITGNPVAKVNPDEVKVDAVVLTHGHNDHFGDTLQIAKNNDCPVIATAELAWICEARGTKAHAMNTGGSHTFDGFTVKFTQAFHSSSVTLDNQMLYAGMPNGVIVTMGGISLYHAGDTSLFSDLKLIGEFDQIDVAALPIGDNFTMGPEEAAIAAEWVKAKHVIPIHYNTFPLIEQDDEAFSARLKKSDIECHPLKVGERFSL